MSLAHQVLYTGLNDAQNGTEVERDGQSLDKPSRLCAVIEHPREWSLNGSICTQELQTTQLSRAHRGCDWSSVPFGLKQSENTLGQM